MSEIRLDMPGLIGSTPLGFLAALGLLRVLDDHSTRMERRRPKMLFDDGGCTPSYISEFNTSDVHGIIQYDSREQVRHAHLALSHQNEDGKAKCDLRMPALVRREILQAALGSSRRDADLVAAFFSDFGVKSGGKLQQTKFDFTSRQKEFRKTAVELLKCVVGDCEEGVLTDEDYPLNERGRASSMGWEISAERNYALASGDGGENAGGKADSNVINVLALHGLGFFPTVPKGGGQLETTCFVGSEFSWPLWSKALTVGTIGSLVCADICMLDMATRAKMGISYVFKSSAPMFGKGQHTFSPPRAYFPRERRSREA